MTEWQTGDVITAEKLNDLESRAGVLVVHINHDDGSAWYRMDKTWQEIYDAYLAGVRVIIDLIGLMYEPDPEDEVIGSVLSVYRSYEPYVTFMYQNTVASWSAVDSDSYPSYFAD